MPTTAAHPDADLRLTVVSATARRMRVHASGFRFDTVRAVAIEDAVGMVTGVEAVRAYPRTASVVIWYTPERCDTASVLSAIADAEHIPVASVPPRTRTRRTAASPVWCNESSTGARGCGRVRVTLNSVVLGDG